jgi:CRP-like cAMP-binding protein
MARLAAIGLLKDAGVDLAPFEARAHWRRFEPNEILVDFDDVSSDVYFLVSGEVRVLIRTPSGKEVILSEMRGGQLFGELAALDGVKRSANVTALTRGEACIMSATVFRELVFSSQVVTDRLFRLLTARVRELNGRLIEHAVLDLRHRLYAELLRMSVPRPGHDGERVVTPPPFPSRARKPHRLPARADHARVHDHGPGWPRRAHPRRLGGPPPRRPRRPRARGLCARTRKPAARGARFSFGAPCSRMVRPDRLRPALFKELR